MFQVEPQDAERLVKLLHESADSLANWQTLFHREDGEGPAQDDEFDTADILSVGARLMAFALEHPKVMAAALDTIDTPSQHKGVNETRALIRLLAR